LNPLGRERPFFCVHAAGGHAVPFLPLARALGDDRAFYGIQSAGLDGRPCPATIEEMADGYLDEIKRTQPHGPYLLGGWSFGGIVAFEMARRLTARGDDVKALAIIDSTLSHVGEEPDPAPADAVARGRHILGALAADLADDDPLLAATADVWTANLRAAKRYKPSCFCGDVTLFRAIDTPAARDDPRWGWTDHVDGCVDVRWIPGDHTSMLLPPHVATLAEQMADLFSHAEAPQPSPDLIAR
jgi:thioesterase domain-containing protein